MANIPSARRIHTSAAYPTHGVLNRAPIALAALATCTAMHAQPAPTAATAPTAPASAASATSAVPAEAEKLTAVVVTGQRASNIASVAAKRSEFRVMDAISADEARALPDSTLAETVQRVPGVAVTYNADNRNGRDEAQRPVIRGMDARYNNATVDGAPLASTDSNNWTTGGSGVRGARLDLLPSSMLKRVEVFKSWTPERDANTIGGSVNVVTRSAFEQGGKPFTSGSSAIGFTNDHGQPRPDQSIGKRAEITTSRVFGEDRTVGLVMAADFRKQDTNTLGHMTTDSGYYNYFTASGSPLGGNLMGAGSNGLAVPAQNKFFLFQNSRERRGLTGKLEYRPHSDLELTLLAGRYESRSIQDRHEQFLDLQRTSAAATAQCPRNLPVSNQTQTSGEIACGVSEVGLQASDTRRSTQIINLGLDWLPAEGHRVVMAHSASRARYDEQVYMAKYIAANLSHPANPQSSIGVSAKPELGLRYDTSELDFSTQLSTPAYAANPANYGAFYWRDIDGHARNRVGNTRLEWEHNMDSSARGLGWSLGLHRNVSRYSYDWNHIEWQPRVSGATLAGAGAASHYILPYTGGLPLMVVDAEASRNQLAASQGQPTLRADTSRDQSLQDDFTLQETIQAAFASVAWGSQDWRMQFGMRHDKAAIDAETFARQTRNDAVDWEPTSSQASYGYLLPSLTLSWQPTRSVTLRAAASKTIGRPNYSHYTPRVTISQATNGDLTVNMGNPDIHPRESINTDLSAEWYYRQGMVSLGLFNKAIQNEIFGMRRVEQMADAAGVLQNATIIRPENSSRARIAGIELGGVLNSLGVIHPSLQAFGLSANWTLLRSRMEVPEVGGTKRNLDRLTGQPDRIANLTVFYSSGGMEWRAAYSRSGLSLRAIENARPWQDVFWAPRSQWDLSARYKFGDSGLAAFVQLANATGAKVISVTGPDRDLLKDSYTVPRTVWVGLSFSN